MQELPYKYIQKLSDLGVILPRLSEIVAKKNPVIISKKATRKDWKSNSKITIRYRSITP